MLVVVGCQGQEFARFSVYVCVREKERRLSCFSAMLDGVHGGVWLEADEAGTDPCMKKQTTHRHITTHQDF